ncbi:hypothetical protein RJ641_025945, partial [Dillenia turbinata]
GILFTVKFYIQILIGPSDWENHSLGKEGSERYRIHNLPNCPSPGLYELGIAEWSMGTGRVEKLDPESIVVVYLGQADDVRTRLQQYGREGAHLENNSTRSHVQANDLESISPGKGAGLFKESFSRGYSIVYRLAPMKSKKIAMKTEAWLLNEYDYAWNKSSNCVRRPDDVLQKLKNTAAPSTTGSSIMRKLQNSNQKKVGIKLEGTKPFLLEDGPSVYVDKKDNDFLSQIFKFGRSQPRVVISRTILEEKNILICGVVLGDGSVCQNLAVEWRKRCVEHKGMRLNGLTTRLILGSKSHASNAGFESRCISNSQSEDRLAAAAAKKCPTNEYFHPPCGLLLDDGSLCISPPTQGRKRCEKHKGKKSHGSISKLEADKASQDLHNFILQPAVSSWNSAMKNSEVVCGVEFPDGSFCTRPPPVGRKRCEEHKGLRVNAHTSKLTASGFHDLNYKDFDSPSIKYVSSSPQTFSNWNTSSYGSSEMCGAATSDGSFCKRQPVEGRKRCWQHKGMRAESTFSGFTVGGDLEICGVTLQNGSLCTRTPASGRKRCQQHKGRRT